MAGSKPLSRRRYFENTVDRFWSFVERGEPDKCWIWRGVHRPPTHSGMIYGQFNITDKGKTVNYRAHRFSWMLFNGRIPPGMVIMHRCDVPLCVNPMHLKCATIAENNRDCHRKGRVAHGENHYKSVLTEDQAVEILKSDEPPQVLADRLGVSTYAIHKVRSGDNWKHVHKRLQ